MGFWDTNGSPNFYQTIRPSNNHQQQQQQQKNCGPCPGWPQSKTERKWNEGISPLTLRGSWKTMVKVTVIPIVIASLGTVTKGLI